MRAVGLGPTALARRLGLPGPEELYRIAETHAPIPPGLARMIHDRYPQISFEWMVRGKAEQETIQMR